MNKRAAAIILALGMLMNQSLCAVTAAGVAFSDMNGPPGTACMMKKVAVITTQTVRIASPRRFKM